MEKKTWIVPIVQTIIFGAEMRVEAESAEEAKQKVLAGEGDNDGWDWNRSSEVARTLGDWQEVVAEEDEGPQPRTCILTGAAGEDPDDCTTHKHEKE